MECHILFFSLNRLSLVSVLSTLSPQELRLISGKKQVLGGEHENDGVSAFRLLGSIPLEEETAASVKLWNPPALITFLQTKSQCFSITQGQPFLQTKTKLGITKLRLISDILHFKPVEDSKDYGLCKNTIAVSSEDMPLELYIIADTNLPLVISNISQKLSI